MSDGPDANQPAPPNPETPPEQEAELDRTRMDVPLGSGPMEVTRSEIYVDTGTREREVTPQPSRPLFKRLGMAGLGNRISAFFKRASNRPPQKKRVRPLPPKLVPYLSIWIASPGLTPARQALFYLSRLLVLAGGAALIALLARSAQYAFSIDSAYRWILLGAAAMAFLLPVAVLLRRGHPAWFFGFPFLIFLALVTVHAFLYPVADPYFFSVRGRAPRFFFNELWLAVFALQALFVLFIFPRARVLKGTLIVALIYGLVGFWINRAYQVPLEASWNGVDFLSKIPVYSAQPVYVALQFLLPLMALLSLAALIALRKEKGRPSWAFVNLMILLVAGALATITLYENRVPSALTLYQKPPLGIGTAQIKEDARLFELRTVNHERLKHSDTAERYRLEIRPLPGAGKGGNADSQKRRYQLSVRDRDDLPVFFLEKGDFILSLNGEKFANWELKPQPDKTDYEITVTFSRQAPRFEITLPPEGPNFSVDDKLKFTLASDGPAGSAYEVSVDGKLIEKKEGLAGERDFAVALSDLDVGKHTVEVTVTGVNGESTTRSQEINVILPRALVIHSPLEGDFFTGSLTVHAELNSQPADGELGLVFYVDDQEVARKSMPPYQVVLDTQSLADGKHILKAVARPLTPADPANPQAGELSDQVEITKGAHPAVRLATPSLGEYVARETPVEVQVEGEAVSQVELLLNDQVLHQWQAPPYQYAWNTLDLPPDRYLLKARAKTQSGAQSSDWVTVSLGEGKIKVLPPGAAGGEGPQAALHYQKVIFVLDASVSMQDGWDQSSKWKWANRVFSMDPVESRLKTAQVGIVVSGGRRPFEYGDCADAREVLAPTAFQSRKAIKELQKEAPKGVSALMEGIRIALDKKPQKIVVLADGPDTCSPGLPADLAKKLKQSKTPVDIVLLGELPDGARKKLEDLAKAASGFVLTAKDGKELEEKAAETLTRNFQVLNQGQIVLSAPIDGNERPLRQGDYTLHIPMDPPFTDQPITIRNGLVAELPLTVEGEQTKIRQDAPSQAVPSNPL